jgi:hypothetical protein
MRFIAGLLFAAVVVLPLPIRSTSAALVVDSIAFNYSQNFDSLFDTVNPANWQNDFTLAGWSLFRINGDTEAAGPVQIQRYEVSDGNSTQGRFYSFGQSPTERSLGAIGNPPFGDGISSTPTVGVPVDSAAGWIVASFLNNSGMTLAAFTANYTGEQWVNAGTSPQTMEFEYGFGSTFETVSMWTKPTGAPISFDFTSPKFTADMGAVPLDGNDAANRTPGLGGTVTNIAWLPGSTLWLRWIERNDMFLDHALAIDDFSFSVTAVPEPAAAVFGGATTALATLVVLTKTVKANFRKRK